MTIPLEMMFKDWYNSNLKQPLETRILSVFFPSGSVFVLCLFLFVLFLLYSLYSPGCPRTYYVDQAVLRLTEILLPLP